MPSTPALNRIRTRAMNRSLARLRDLHRTEYDRILVEELARAHAEARSDISRSRVEHPGEQPPPRNGNSGSFPQKQLPVPPSLIPGRRPAGAPRLREDVARCPYCQRFHDRGHECPSCRHRPAGAPPANPYKASA